MIKKTYHKVNIYIIIPELIIYNVNKSITTNNQYDNDHILYSNIDQKIPSQKAVLQAYLMRIKTEIQNFEPS